MILEILQFIIYVQKIDMSQSTKSNSNTHLLCYWYATNHIHSKLAFKFFKVKL